MAKRVLSEQQLRGWRHGSLQGRAAMAASCMKAIVTSPTATDKAKAIALNIQRLTEELISALKERKE